MVEKQIGVLGAGQLGKMLAQIAADWSLSIHGLDPDPFAPARHIYESFTCGDFNDYDTVMQFGKNKDLITIEIEHVNTKALRDLKASGVIVHPSPEALEIIKDKGSQKMFYLGHKIPTAPFQLVENKTELLQLIQSGRIALPFVQKSREAGYDGKGVKVIRDLNEIEQAMDTPSVIEEMANIEKELAIIVSRNENNKSTCFPVVEMLFNEKANLVENLICPAAVSEDIREKCAKISIEIIQKLNMSGILAVEFFLLQNGDLWVNEVAPRPHNSGHHTIEACYTSQYQQHLRAILNLSPGNTDMKCNFAMMINLLGEAGFEGAPVYQGMNSVLSLPNTYIHLYGKQKTKPFRKMGHITMLADSKEKLLSRAAQVSTEFKVIAKN